MPIFPLRARPKEDYKTPPRSFGCHRANNRKHAGCDLYAPVGTEILAVEDGEVILGAYPFYAGTFALEVKHTSGVVRYGEIESMVGLLKTGTPVKAGQVIARVGRLQGMPMSMLHFEKYTGTLTGPLTNRNNAEFSRRLDLIDPTEYLDS